MEQRSSEREWRGDERRAAAAAGVNEQRRSVLVSSRPRPAPPDMAFFLRGGGGGGDSFGDALNDALGTLNQLVGDGGRGPPRPPPRGGYDNTGRDPLAGLADQLGGLGGLGGLAGLAGLRGFGGGGHYSDWGSIKDRYFRPRPKPPPKPKPPMSFGDIVGKTKGAYHFINRLLPKSRDPSISNPALLPFAPDVRRVRCYFASSSGPVAARRQDRSEHPTSRVVSVRAEPERPATIAELTSRRIHAAASPLGRRPPPAP
ncbi:N-(5'-phosphoribosyl)anthranilate isomerase [Frankliniella fusca]|uniref:N-(5'-phosphoribosyl)anthranilate isomerase n=1 Tax=Frankliniella fusca TaxID=407009 RepID=A0AAE1LDX3_9NEOP|nr:N-(5'-phosphoribosyl)anthranilate isomerase [Frankliniella fusca]